MDSLRTSLVAVALVFVSLSGCDVSDPLHDVRLRMDVIDAPINLNGDVASLMIRGGESTAQENAAENDLDVSSVDEVQRLKVQPSYLVFEPAAAKSSRGAGTVRLGLFIGGVPIPGAILTITIENNAVTDVSPTVINVHAGNMDVQAVHDLLENLEPSGRPNLKSWRAMSLAEILDHLNAALESSTFPIALVADVSGDLEGRLSLRRIDIDARVEIKQ